jgi:AcrR family transcriptional regulator
MARPASDIQPRILAAARARFLQEGVDGASLRAIATDARTSIGMVYYYFPTKDDLFFAVIEDVYVALLADLTRALGADADVAERFRRLYRRLGAMSETEAITVRLIMREILVSNTRLERLVERFKRGHIPLVLATVRDGMHAGAIDPQLPPLLVTLVAFVVGAAPQFLLARIGPHLPIAMLPKGAMLGDLLVRVLFEGVGVKERPRAPRKRGVRRKARQ